MSRFLANKRIHAPGIFGACALLLLAWLVRANETFAWRQLSPLPEKLGMAGAFAGVSGGVLLVAGGANFPDKMPWEVGRKVWRDVVYVLAQPDGKWRIAGRLPHPLGYGVSVSHRDDVICVGGSDAQRHYADVFRLRWWNNKLLTEALPPLPITLANMSGALAGDVLYVAGGTETPGEQSAIRRFFVLDLGAPQLAWHEHEPVPGRARMLATAATHDGDFFLLGGAALAPNADGKVSRVYLREALRYRPGRGWSRLADMPRPNVAASTPAPWVNGKFLLIGGDDGSRVGFIPPEKHPGFPNRILACDPLQDRWADVGEVPAPRATLPCVEWRGMFVMPSGEVRPGVRSPEVWAFVENEIESRKRGGTEK